MSDCPSDKEEITSKPDKNYRFFNQPIEQIPGYAGDEVQILLHAAGCGLKWHTVECLDIVTCIRLTESELAVDQRKAVIIKDLAIPDPTCSGIPVTQCSGTGGSGSSPFEASPYSLKPQFFDINP